MKIFVVLALAVFSGCSANLFHAEEPKSMLDEWTRTVEDCMRIAFQTADKTYEKFKQTKFGHQVDEQLKESASVAFKTTSKAFNELPPETKEMVIKFVDAGLILGYYVGEGLKLVNKGLEPLAEMMAPEMQTVAEELVTSTRLVADKASSYADKLIENVDPLAQDVQARLISLYKSFF